MEERKLRIISGTPVEVEEQINRLLDHYAAVLWNWAWSHDQVVVSCVLVHESELRKAALAAGVGPGSVRH